jgi:hypothetical protein
METLEYGGVSRHLAAATAISINNAERIGECKTSVGDIFHSRSTCSANSFAFQTESFATFKGDAFTVLLAGFAAKSIGSFVNGLMPLASFGRRLIDDRQFSKARDYKLTGLIEFLVANDGHMFDDRLHVALRNGA